MTLLGWLRDYPYFLVKIYVSFGKLFLKSGKGVEKFGFKRVDNLIRFPEEFSKKLIFDCKMCGQCTLHSTGMTCPMTCPKHLRNGPCGGVSVHETCEVIPDMKCIWVEAYQREQKMSENNQGLIFIQPPLNHNLKYKSAWINKLCCEDAQMPSGWKLNSQKEKNTIWG